MLGTNLSSPTYYSPQWVFADLMKQSGEWVTQNVTRPTDWDTRNQNFMNVDSQGYPLEIPFLTNDISTPQIVATRLGNNTYPSGVYILTFEGEGEISVQGANVECEKINSNQYNLIAKSSGSFILKILKSSLGNHVRNIKVIMPDCKSTDLFNPIFLQSLKGYKVLRFMDWMNTNSSEIVNWKDITKVDWYTQSRKGYGVSPQYMISLTNLTDSDIWINIPHKADNSYILNLARLLKRQLKKTKKIYVEYSNELWNNLFPQHEWLISQGVADSDTFTPNREILSGLNYHVKRLCQISNLFKTVFQKDYSNRIILVAGSQASNRFITFSILNGFKNPKLNPNNVSLNALAIAPYFSANGFQKKSYNDSTTPEQLLNYASQHLLEFVIPNLQKHKELTDLFNTSLIAYEGGQHLTPSIPQRKYKNLINSMCEANRDYIMGELYIKYLHNWFSITENNLFIHFNHISDYGQYGCWGALECQDQLTSPKYQALQKFMQI